MAISFRSKTAILTYFFEFQLDPIFFNLFLFPIYLIDFSKIFQFDPTSNLKRFLSIYSWLFQIIHDHSCLFSWMFQIIPECSWTFLKFCWILSLFCIKSNNYKNNKKVTLGTACFATMPRKIINLPYSIRIRIIQVVMLRAKFGRIKIRTYLLQRFDTNFGHFDNNFCYKIDKTNHDFSNEIADCCSIRLATLIVNICWNMIQFFIKI